MLFKTIQLRSRHFRLDKFNLIRFFDFKGSVGDQHPPPATLVFISKEKKKVFGGNFKFGCFFGGLYDIFTFALTIYMFTQHWAFGLSALFIFIFSDMFIIRELLFEIDEAPQAKKTEKVKISKYENLIGKTAVVISDLKPHGLIKVDGERIPAKSQLELIPKDTEVKIAKAELTEVIVKKL